MAELTGKDRADLSTAPLKKLLKVWENQRDTLCDEISFKKGECKALEENIKLSYQLILDINKEEQIKDREAIAAKVEELKKKEEEVKTATPATEVLKKKGKGKGITPKPKKRVRSKKKT